MQRTALLVAILLVLALPPAPRLQEGRDHERRDRSILSDLSSMGSYFPPVVDIQEDTGLRHLPPVRATPTRDATDGPVVGHPTEPSAPVRITHYYCIGDLTGTYCGLTASGAPVAPGVAACDPARLGEVVQVDQDTYRCLDTGGAVRGDHIDIWCYSPDRWGWPPDNRPCPDYPAGTVAIWQDGGPP